MLFGKENSGELMSRKDIESKYTWNLEDIYSTEEAWEKDFTWLEEAVSKYEQYKGKLGESGVKLLEFLKFDESVGIIFGRLMRYASLAKDLDLADTKYQAFYNRADALGANLQAAGSFTKPEILSLPEETL